jgi:hypothetical protein
VDAVTVTTFDVPFQAPTTYCVYVPSAFCVTRMSLAAMLLLVAAVL